MQSSSVTDPMMKLTVPQTAAFQHTSLHLLRGRRAADVSNARTAKADKRSMGVSSVDERAMPSIGRQ